MRALVVDDDTVSRLVLAHILRKAGWDVTQADDVAAAVAAAPGADVVFCDYRLPSGTGLDVLAGVRETCADVPFVLVTGVVEHADMGDHPPDGVAALLSKPVSTATVTRVLAGLGPAV